MRDPYLYSDVEVLKNLGGLKTEIALHEMEADYVSLRLSELVVDDYTGIFDIKELCRIHYIMFQDIFEWAGKFRIINIEKAEPALGGISIEYSDCFDVENDLNYVLNEINSFACESVDFDTIVSKFSKYMAAIWKAHPFREGNTRTIVTFCSRFIESRGLYVDSDLFKDNAAYMRTALVAASAVFSDLGDRRKAEYLENIVSDALKNGLEMKKMVQNEIKTAGMECTEELIRKVVFWDRKEDWIHSGEEIKRQFKGE